MVAYFDGMMWANIRFMKVGRWNFELFGDFTYNIRSWYAIGR